MYAKFDKLAAELSDDEDARPSVTRLGAPSRVTIGPAGASVAQPQAQPSSVEVPRSYHWEPRPNPPFGPVRRAARRCSGDSLTSQLPLLFLRLQQRKPGTNELDYSKWDKWVEAQRCAHPDARRLCAPP